MADLWKEKEDEFLAACKKLKLPVEVNYVDKQDNVPGEPFWGRVPKKISIHQTGNTNAGADARAHRKFVADGGGKDLASYTMTNDDKRVILVLRLDWASNHAGNVEGNFTSGAIESCVNSDRDPDKTYDNTAKAVAAWLTIWGLPLSVVVQHNYWFRPGKEPPHKDCPFQLRRKGWNEVLLDIDKYRTQLLNPDTDKPICFPDVEGITSCVQGGFKQLWLELGLTVMGYPLTNEFQEVEPRLGGITVTRQLFENVRTIWYDGIQPRIEALGTEYQILKERCP
ncbi:MAG TPA: N-acetylmuramoyl-L-alanine amidase [Chloroflexia bacterium]|jgi:hypothetical protein